jgi:hypothetical protein
VLWGPPIPHTIHRPVGRAAQGDRRPVLRRPGPGGAGDGQAERRKGHIDPHVEAVLAASHGRRSVGAGDAGRGVAGDARSRAERGVRPCERRRFRGRRGPAVCAQEHDDGQERGEQHDHSGDDADRQGRTGTGL